MRPIFREFDHKLFLTDGGLETSLIYHLGKTLRHFAAFELLNNAEGQQALRDYYQPYLVVAGKYGAGFILETPTWRANPDWGFKLGYSRDELTALNKSAVTFMRSIVADNDSSSNTVIISGNIGPRGDGYKVENCMTADQARAYHYDQVQAFAQADADVVTAMTINYSDEAIGIVRAAQLFRIPVIISFTVETNGKLPNGESLKSAIEKTDTATGRYAEHFMINCAHPEHFNDTLLLPGEWKFRIRGIRANASTRSHAELDEASTLDAGDKASLAQGYWQLTALLPELLVLGGCCGTDHSHLDEICKCVLAEQ